MKVRCSSTQYAENGKEVLTNEALGVTLIHSLGTARKCQVCLLTNKEQSVVSGN
jgi:hypothetical protein